MYQKETATSVVTKSVVHAAPSEVTPVDNSGIPASDELMKSGDDSSGLTLCTACAQITRDADVRLCTGMQNTDAFRTLFEYLLPKAKNMNYWKEDKQTEAEKPKRYSDMTMDEFPNVRKKEEEEEEEEENFNRYSPMGFSASIYITSSDQ